MTITFIGHGSISITPDIKSRLYNEIENLIHSNENVIFFCGGAYKSLQFARKRKKSIIDIANP